MRILTYTDPFQINQNKELWDLVTSHPHYCATDTLVQGLSRYYGTTTFKLIRPIQDLISAFLKKYADNPINDMKMFLTVSDCIHSWLDSPLKESFLFNKSEVVKAIQFLIPLKCDPSRFDRSQLSDEQSHFLDILQAVHDSECYQAFEGLRSLDWDDYTYALKLSVAKEIAHTCNNDHNRELLLSQGFPENQLSRIGNDLGVAVDAAQIMVDFLNQKIEEDLFGLWYQQEKESLETLTNCLKFCNTDADHDFCSKIIVHGVHRITPIMYFMLMKLEDELGVEVLFLINYADNVPAIYDTWKHVYEWVNTKFEYAESLDFASGKPLGKTIAQVLSGMVPEHKPEESLTTFDNLTSFSLHEVGKEYRRVINQPVPRRLHEMKKQYYSVDNADCNSILQMYFPEQFENKPFLSYPVGQFILGLYQMWDFDEARMHYNFSSLQECAVSGLCRNDSSLMELMKKLELYFSDVETSEEYSQRIALLREAIALERKSAFRGLKHISFFSVSEQEINQFEEYINNIRAIAEELFDGIDSAADVNYIEHFHRLMTIIETRAAGISSLSASEHQLISAIKERLAGNSEGQVNGNPKDIKDALAFFLSERDEKQGSNWIVRTFDQLDGAVLLSPKTNAKTYHFALLSNKHMLYRGIHDLPWPLTEELFNSYEEVHEALSAVTAGHKEHCGYLKYILFYGVFFSRVNIEFSYIAEENGETQIPYYLLTAAGFNNKVFSEETPAQFIHNTGTDSISAYDYQPDERAREMFSVCPYKYLIFDVFNADTIYYSEYHIKYFMSYYITYVVYCFEKANPQLGKSDILQKLLPTFRKFLPFWGDVVFKDLENSALDALSHYPEMPPKIVHQRKADFLIAKWTDPKTDYVLNFRKPGLEHKISEYLQSDRMYPTQEEIPARAICDNCSFGDICLRNYYEAHIESETDSATYMGE